MPRPSDAIMPVLQRIQKGLGDVRRDVGDVKREVSSLSERMAAVELCITHTTGLHSQNQADVTALEERPG